jgi:hypothetical protein
VQALHKVDAVFDDPNLIGSAGLVPVMRLADRAGLHELLPERLSVPSANAGAKAACVVAGFSPALTVSTTSAWCVTAG